MGKAELTEELAGILGVAITADPRKWIGAVHARLDFLGYGETCTRCGGTGNYSYNPLDGTRCFKCGGMRTVIPSRMTKATKAALVADVQAGKLKPYFELQAVKAKARRAVDAVMAAWTATGISKLYRWQDACGPNAKPEAVRLSSVNKIMCDAYDKVSKAHGVYMDMVRKGADGINQQAAALAAMAEAAIAEINEAAKLI